MPSQITRTLVKKSAMLQESCPRSFFSNSSWSNSQNAPPPNEKCLGASLVKTGAIDSCSEVKCLSFASKFFKNKIRRTT